MKYETAGDPTTGLKWTRKATRKVARELQQEGIMVSAKSVARILKKMGYSLQESRTLSSFNLISGVFFGYLAGMSRKTHKQNP
jgi:hypothetical protein